MELYLISYYDIFLSSLRWLLGLTCGSILGLALGIASDSLPKAVLGFKTNLLNFLRAIPILALIPLIQINFGINEFAKIGLIAWAVAFPVWISVKTSLSSDLKNLYLVFKAAQVDKNHLFLYFYLPKVMAGFIKGIDIGIGVAWLSVVAAEWIGTYNFGFWGGGLGYKLDYGYNIGNWYTVHLAILIFGTLGTVSSFVYRYILKSVMRDTLLVDLSLFL